MDDRTAELRRQSEAFLRAPHEDHNRRTMGTTMDDLRHRRTRRRYRGFMRTAVTREVYGWALEFDDAFRVAA